MEKTKILVIFANPKIEDLPPLDLEREDRTIRESIERAPHRNNLSYQIRHAARVRDMQRALLEDDYKIIHFGGHANSSGQLILEDEIGEPKYVPMQALADLLSNFPSIECVILNACHTIPQGELIVVGVRFAVAMDGPISDEGAKVFTRGFYDAIGAGKDYRFAHRMGCLAMELEGYPEGKKPQFFEKNL